MFAGYNKNSKPYLLQRSFKGGSHMKKLLVLMLALFLVCGCSSEKSEEGPDNTTEIVITPTEGVEEEGALRSDSTVRTLTFGGNPERSEIPEITRENNDFLQIIAYIEEILYGDIPEGADYPAVKYLPGEWVYCICAYESNFGDNFYDLGYAEFEYEKDGDIITATLHPRLYWEGDELYPEDDGETDGAIFSGTRVAENRYYALEDYFSDILAVYCYYRYEGMEYVLAEFWVSEESYADVLFYRGVQQ